MKSERRRALALECVFVGQTLRGVAQPSFARRTACEEVTLSANNPPLPLDTRTSFYLPTLLPVSEIHCISPRPRSIARSFVPPRPTPPPPHSDDDRSLRRPAGAGGRSAALRRRAPAAVQWCANHSAATRARLYAPTIGAFAATGGVCASNWIRLRASLRSRLLDCAKSGGAHCTSRWPVPRTSHLPLSQTQNHRRARRYKPWANWNPSISASSMLA